MAVTARDLMQTQVITVSPETPLANLQRLFYEEEIHGAPVVDELGRLLGIITTMDVLRAATEQHDAERGRPATVDVLAEVFEFSAADWREVTERLEDRFGELTVCDAMTEEVVSIGPDAKVPEIARTLREHRIHRVLVVESGRLLGIISTFDLVALLERPD